MTRSILGIDSIPADVGFNSVDLTNYALVDMSLVPNGREALYQRIVGDVQFPLTVRVGYYPAKGGNGSTNISIRVNSFVQEVVDTVVVSTLPCSATIATSMPGVLGVPDVTSYKEMLQNALSWFMPTITAEAFADEVVTSLQYGIVTNYQVG